jgi:agmatinase
VVPDTSSPAATLERIERVAREIVSGGKFLVALGGEHSVTAPLVRAVRGKNPGLGVLQLDAHADLRDSFEGSPHNHACVMRRVIDDGVPLAQVGVRSLTGEERALIRELGICTVFAPEAVGEPVESWIGRVLSALPEDVYVTVDLDAFDPAVMPATGTPEPGGLDWYRALAVLREVARRKRIVGFDVVELAPIPGNVAPDFLAAKLAYRLLGYAFLLERSAL